MNLDYPRIFDARGHSYHRAMLDQPNARNAEFAGLFAEAEALPGQRVFDIPAGGGYLARLLPGGVELHGMELSAGFGSDMPIYIPGQPWPWGQFDHGVCLAALHHIDDQEGFIAGLMDRVRPGGTLHLGDVSATSGISRFLDEFVAQYNQTGHVGKYLSTESDFSRFGHVSRLTEAACDWVFDCTEQMLRFCTKLFGLVDCPRPDLLSALRNYVGVSERGQHTVLHWKLLYVDIQRR